ncbi:DUF488 domain-containing protein [Nitratireductor aquimarinus]|uniref:DUF488 domain-containing protein n=1 Tax=Nitratireductor aquimarinus TaxID=889300 RepID=UPI002936A837|nr:DUF488 domain-containing protein [Nitratireductor aquimarinus]MDV2964607.1 DUF488 domain-containing protein [Nitratireductor aquimarinus]
MSIAGIRLKRIYDPVEPEDGARILVDRLWPRGVSKERAALESWLPQIGPSHELRRWFAHQPERWDTFCNRYCAELKEQPDLLEDLREKARKGPVTLLFSARDRERNQAAVIRNLLQESTDG